MTIALLVNLLIGLIALAIFAAWLIVERKIKASKPRPQYRRGQSTGNSPEFPETSNTNTNTKKENPHG